MLPPVLASTCPLVVYRCAPEDRLAFDNTPAAAHSTDTQLHSTSLNPAFANCFQHCNASKMQKKLVMFVPLILPYCNLSSHLPGLIYVVHRKLGPDHRPPKADECTYQVSDCKRQIQTALQTCTTALHAQCAVQQHKLQVDQWHIAAETALNAAVDALLHANQLVSCLVSDRPHNSTATLYI